MVAGGSEGERRSTAHIRDAESDLSEVCLLELSGELKRGVLAHPDLRAGRRVESRHVGLDGHDVAIEPNGRREPFNVAPGNRDVKTLECGLQPRFSQAAAEDDLPRDVSARCDHLGQCGGQPGDLRQGDLEGAVDPGVFEPEREVTPDQIRSPTLLSTC